MYFHQIKNEEIYDLLSYLELQTAQWATPCNRLASRREYSLLSAVPRWGRRTGAPPLPTIGPWPRSWRCRRGVQASRACQIELYTSFHYCVSPEYVVVSPICNFSLSHQYWPMSNRYALQPNMMREYHGGRQDECGHYRLSKRTPSAYESWSNTGVLDVTSRPGWIGQGSAYRIITLQSHTLHVLPLTVLWIAELCVL